MTFKQLPISCFIGNCASKKSFFSINTNHRTGRPPCPAFFGLPQEEYIPGTDWNKQPQFATGYTQGLANRGYRVSAPGFLWKRQNGANLMFAPFCISAYKLSGITVGKSPHKTAWSTSMNMSGPARALGLVCRLI